MQQVNDANATFAWLDCTWSNRDSTIAGCLSDPPMLL